MSVAYLVGLVIVVPFGALVVRQALDVVDHFTPREWLDAAAAALTLVMLFAAIGVWILIGDAIVNGRPS